MVGVGPGCLARKVDQIVATARVIATSNNREVAVFGSDAFQCGH